MYKNTSNGLKRESLPSTEVKVEEPTKTSVYTVFTDDKSKKSKPRISLKPTDIIPDTKLSINEIENQFKNSLSFLGERNEYLLDSAWMNFLKLVRSRVKQERTTERRKRRKANRKRRRNQK